MEPDFMIEDQGDGWWHCASPLACFIVDGPAPYLSGAFWLVRTEPAIEWNGSALLHQRVEGDEEISQPREPTNLALVMALPSREDSQAHATWGIPVYPVTGTAQKVSDAAGVGSLGVKAKITGLA